MGIKDVIVLERDQLTSGTTWHAAGLMVTFGSTSETATDIRKYSKSLTKPGGRDWAKYGLQAGGVYRACLGKRPAGGVPKSSCF